MEQEVVGADTGCHVSDQLVRQLTWKRPALERQEKREAANRQLAATLKGKTAHGIEVELRDALQRGDAEFVLSCLRCGAANVNTRNPADGRALLHQAALLGDKAMIKALLSEFGAVPNVRTFLGGDTPLHCAAKAGARACCFFLIQGGANAMALNRMKQTPLHFAATKNTARVLIEWGAEVFQKDRLGRSPLAMAIEHDQQEVAEYLGSLGEALLIERATGDKKKRQMQEQLKHLDEEARLEAERKGLDLTTGKDHAQLLMMEYKQWRRGEHKEAVEVKEAISREVRAKKTMARLSVFHHKKLPGAYTAQYRVKHPHNNKKHH
jgi:ankyrin repeat protein